MMKKRKMVCVFCGANDGNSETVRAATKELARLIVQRGYGLVYGGASVGLMGLVADEVLKLGGEVVGIIPRKLMEAEVAHKNLTELHVVESMHQRKQMMYDLSEGFLTLPGGFGTLDETFEVVTWKQIEIQEKPIILLNIDGYYTKLVEFIDSASEFGFIKKKHLPLLKVAESVDESLFDILDNLR